MPSLGPAIEPLSGRVAGAVGRASRIAPGNPGVEDTEDAVDDDSVELPGMAGPVVDREEGSMIAKWSSGRACRSRDKVVRGAGVVFCPLDCMHDDYCQTRPRTRPRGRRRGRAFSSPSRSSRTKSGTVVAGIPVPRRVRRSRRTAKSVLVFPGKSPFSPSGHRKKAPGARCGSLHRSADRAASRNHGPYDGSDSGAVRSAFPHPLRPTPPGSDGVAGAGRRTGSPRRPPETGPTGLGFLENRRTIPTSRRLK